MANAATSALGAARSLAPLIKANADANERDRHLQKPVFEAMADAGMFHLLLPRSLGGQLLDLPTYVEVMEELGKADASSAWVTNQVACFGAYAASRLPEDVARKVWRETPRSLFANSPAPTIEAEVVEGGFRVNGKQGFATGCHHATWIGAHAKVVEHGKPRMVDGVPDTRFFVMPISQVKIVDTWHVRGMRGTGTDHFQVDNVFVTPEWTLPSLGPALRTDGPLYKMPFSLAFAGGDAAIALGMARSCLAAFYELASTKTPHAVPGLLRDQPFNQVAIGQAEGNVRAGRAFVMDAVAAAWKEVSASGAMPMEHRANTFLACNHAIRLAAHAIDAVYNMAGTTAMYEGSLIQRSFQDIHVITQHVQARMQNYEKVGRYYLGLDVGPLVY